MRSLEHIILGYQLEILNRLKLFEFAESAIIDYSRKLSRELTNYEFIDFKNKFKLIQFKPNIKIPDIQHKEIINISDNFIKNELADSIFVLNISTFENWLLKLIKEKFNDNPKLFFPKNNKVEEKKMPLSIILESNDLIELNNKIIDDYLIGLPYKGMKSLLNTFILKFKLSKTKFPNNLIEKINEISLVRNLIVHNQKKVNETYIFKAGNFARYKKGETVILSKNDLFNQGDLLLTFMQIFRKNYQKV